MIRIGILYLSQRGTRVFCVLMIILDVVIIYRLMVNWTEEA